MKKGTLARLEMNLGMLVLAALLALAGYGLVSALADRLDPKVRDCVEHQLRSAGDTGHPMSRAEAVKFCKRLEAIGAL